MLIVEPGEGAFWLQVRGAEEDLAQLRRTFLQETLDQFRNDNRPMHFSRSFP